MNKVFLNIFLLLTLNSNIVNCQVNLIPNPSFEILDSCYGGFSGLGFDVFQWSNCIGWLNPTLSSSDLWCDNPIFGTLEPPYNGTNYQFPRTGKNMAGAYIYEVAGYPNYREYIQSELIMPMEAGKFYYFGIYLNSADTFNYSSCFGVYFSELPVYQPSSWNVLPYSPQVINSNTTFIKDTLGWQLFDGVYQASGGEKYLTIGCFDDSSKIVLSNYDSTTAGSVYFFIDDAELIEIDSELEIPNIFTPNNDGLNDLFTPNVINIEKWHCTIFNRWGQIVIMLDEGMINWNGRDKFNNLCVDGIYYYLFNGFAKGKEIKTKGFIQLVK